MNSLEFINEKIKETERSIRHWEMQLKNYPDDEVLTRCLNTRKEELQALQQIKTILEAWEVVKGKVKIIPKDNMVVEFIIRTMYSSKNYETIKKALEVKDNDFKK